MSKRRLSAAQIPTLVGVWGREAAERAWAEARGLVEPRVETFRMRLGAEMTQVVLRLAECPRENAFYEYPVARSFPAGDLKGRIDAWLPKQRTVWEAKTHARLTERAMLAAYLQVQLYAALVGAERAVCAHLEFNSAMLTVKEYEFNTEVAERLLAAAEHLLENWESDAAVLDVLYYLPSPAEKPAVLSREMAALAALEELAQVRAQRIELERQEQMLRERVLELLADGEYSVGNTIARIETRTKYTLDPELLPEDLRARCMRESTYRTIVFVKPREERDAADVG